MSVLIFHLSTKPYVLNKITTRSFTITNLCGKLITGKHEGLYFSKYFEIKFSRPRVNINSWVYLFISWIDLQKFAVILLKQLCKI